MTEHGRRSTAQRAVEQQFAEAGAVYAICRSVDEVRATLAKAGILV